MAFNPGSACVLTLGSPLLLQVLWVRQHSSHGHMVQGEGAHCWSVCEKGQLRASLLRPLPSSLFSLANVVITVPVSGAAVMIRSQIHPEGGNLRLTQTLLTLLLRGWQENVDFDLFCPQPPLQLGALFRVKHSQQSILDGQWRWILC